MQNKISIRDFTNIVLHLNDKLIAELLETLNHVDDMMTVTYMKAYFISRVHQNCLKLKKGILFYRKLYKSYRTFFIKDIVEGFHVNDKKFLKESAGYFDLAYEMIEKIFDSYEYHSFLEFENICNLILSEMVRTINQKNNTNVSIDMKNYEVLISDSFAMIEKVLVNL